MTYTIELSYKEVANCTNYFNIFIDPNKRKHYNKPNGELLMNALILETFGKQKYEVFLDDSNTNPLVPRGFFIFHFSTKEEEIAFRVRYL